MDKIIPFPSNYRPPAEDMKEIRQLLLVVLDEIAETRATHIKLLRLLAEHYAKDNLAQRAATKKRNTPGS